MRAPREVLELLARGVRLPAPETVHVAPEVDPARVARGAVIHPGCRLAGARLSIGPDAVIGAESPMTVVDCQLGAGVHLAGGYAERATFLDGFRAGSGAHIRPGCLFEEGASLAHCVGVKQTVFMPWATAGSLVNFCDALLAGGTGPRNHSEIGSSYVHFNFTPRQDKATASLIGDVPHGALLNQPPVFLGGQGGLVGPCVIAYGTVIPAGQIWRDDVEEPGRLIARPAFPGALDAPFDPRQYRRLDRVLRNNLAYLGNLAALDVWYRIVRARFMLADPFQAACHAGARQRLGEMLAERLLRLDELAGRVARALDPESAVPADDPRRVFVARWPSTQERLTRWLATREAAAPPPDVQTVVDALPRDDYLRAIQSLPPEQAQRLSDWLAAWARGASKVIGWRPGGATTAH